MRDALIGLLRQSWYQGVPDVIQVGDGFGFCGYAFGDNGGLNAYRAERGGLSD